MGKSSNFDDASIFYNRLYITGGTNGIRFRENNADRWDINPSGHFVPSSDSTYDIGTSSIRVLNGYFDNLYGLPNFLSWLPYHLRL